jgi:hypothetical protein
MRTVLHVLLCAVCTACAPGSAAHEGSDPAHGQEAEQGRAASSVASAMRVDSSGATTALARRTEPRLPSATPADPAAAKHEPPASAGAESAPVFEHALLVSVDGLRSDALRAVAASELPNFRRFMKGAGTLNARTDPDFTVTLPNHTDMITGRPVLGPRGHGWIKNDDADPDETLHKNHGAYVASMFDVAHDRGFHTGLFAGKTKFAIYDASYDDQNGEPDVSGGGPSGERASSARASDGRAADGASSEPSPASTGAAAPKDHGRRKIDVWKFAGKTEEISQLVIAHLGADGKRSLLFAHYAVTDLTGHANGWDVTPRSRYMQAVAAVDKDLGRILDAVEGDDRLRGKTAIVLTADHGGGAPFKSHDQIQMWTDYIIPFWVWTGDGAKGGDLYAINAAVRRDPGITSPRVTDDGPPPIRNGDAGNLLLSLLGLPPVPGSTFDAGEELKIR